MIDFTPNELGKRIQELRKVANLTQEELADKVDVSYSSIAKLEQGKIDNPSFFTILNLSELLNSSLDQVVGLSSKSPSGASSEPTATIKTVVFDINGVLVTNFSHIFVKIAELTGADPHQVEECFWRYDGLVVDGTMSINDFERALAADLQTDPNDLNYSDILLSCVESFEPAHQLLVKLSARYQVALMSNIFPSFPERFFEAELLPKTREYYAACLMSSELKAAKPFDKIYEVAEHRLGDPSSLLFIDDTPANIETALRRGWQGVVYDQDDWQNCHQQIESILSQ